jgi:hypothetical protein
MHLKNLVFLFVLIAFSCQNKSHQNAGKTTRQKEIIIPEKEKPVKLKLPEIHYSALPYRKSDSAIAYFKDHFTESQKAVIYSLNRIDAHDVHRADTLIIPDTFIPDWNAYSPFPLKIPALDSVNKIVIFSYPIQAFAAYENGVLKRWGPTSLGSRSHPTPTGLHFANWKSKKSVSSVKDEWILPWNFNIINKAGVGWHEYHMPGYPASHSCLRLHEEDAKWLYYFAEQWILESDVKLLAQGTPVIVFGSYSYGDRKPWLNLLDNPKANNISMDDLLEILKPYLPKIMSEQERREKVLTGKTAEPPVKKETK